jgi:hypothetical protein
MLTAWHRSRATLLPRPVEPLRARRDPGLATPGATAFPPQPTGDPQIADQTTVRPPSTERDRDCSPSPSVLTTRRYARSHQKTGSASRTREGSSMRGPLSFTGPPSELGGRSRKRPHRRPSLVWKQETQTTRTATCHGARRCCHRRVIPAGQPASQRRPRSTRAVPRGGCPLAQRMGARPRQNRKRSRPVAPPSVRGDDAKHRASSGSHVQVSCHRPEHTCLAAPAPGLRPSLARLRRRSAARVRKRTLTKPLPARTRVLRQRRRPDVLR